MKSPKISNTKGFTIIEILIVVALIGLISAMGLMMSFDTLARSSVESERDVLVGLLQSQRSRALANIHARSQGLHITEDTIFLFEGDSFDPNDGENRVISRNPEVLITSLPIDVVFEHKTGNASEVFLELSQSAKQAHVEINSVGRIEF